MLKAMVRLAGENSRLPSGALAETLCQRSRLKRSSASCRTFAVSEGYLRVFCWATRGAAPESRIRMARKGIVASGEYQREMPGSWGLARAKFCAAGKLQESDQRRAGEVTGGSACSMLTRLGSSHGGSFS